MILDFNDSASFISTACELRCKRPQSLNVDGQRGGGRVDVVAEGEPQVLKLHGYNEVCEREGKRLCKRGGGVVKHAVQKEKEDHMNAMRLT